jgi:hypothetical protein
MQLVLGQFFGCLLQLAALKSRANDLERDVVRQPWQGFDIRKNILWYVRVLG